MKFIFLTVFMLLALQLHAADGKGKTKKAAPLSTPDAMTVAPKPPAKPVPVIVQPPLEVYRYEVNTAPLAFAADWYSLDLLRYDPPSEGMQFGYGLSMISFLRNNNNTQDTFPSWNGYAFGAAAVWDHKDYYYSAHGFFEKYDRFQAKGSDVQDREGPRVNLVVGVKETFKKRFALKFGWGVELQSYKVREYDETNRFVQTNYHTLIFNPFFLEMKLACYF